MTPSVQTLRQITVVLIVIFLLSLVIITSFSSNMNISTMPAIINDNNEDNVDNNELGEEQTLYYSFHKDCPCFRRGRSLSSLQSNFDINWLYSKLSEKPVNLSKGEYVGPSSCNDYTTSLGAAQKVRSYSLYFPSFSKWSSKTLYNMFASTIPELSQRMKETLPDWRMRIYSNVSKDSQPESFQLLCNVTCQHDHVDVCLTSNLPKNQPMFYELAPSLTFGGVKLAPLKDFSNVERDFNMGMWWRFIPVADPTVQYYSSRDLDSFLLDREIAAMSEWLRSGAQFHTMRDMPEHRSSILGGLWDMNTYKNFANAIRIRALMFDTKIFDNFGNFYRDYSLDQKTLATRAYGVFWQDLMAHTSYFLCGRIHSTPWPTRRENTSIYVGIGRRRLSFILRKPLTPCPMQCRPKNHQDWTYC